MRRNLATWQWQLYADNHTTRANLLRHIVSWPFFPGGLATAAVGVGTGHWWLIPPGLLALPIVMAVQGAGHKLEVVPPVPFDGPSDALSRILVEQLFTFPRFLLTGGLVRAWRKNS